MNNIFTFIGRITKDIELRTTQNDKKTTTITLAMNEDKEHTNFIPVTLWNTNAELVEKYCKKGDLIAVKGIVRNHNYTDKNNVNHYDYNFVGNQVLFLNTKKEDKKVQDIPTNAKTEYDDLNSDVHIDDSDLPF